MLNKGRLIIVNFKTSLFSLLWFIICEYCTKFSLLVFMPHLYLSFCLPVFLKIILKAFIKILKMSYRAEKRG